MPASLTRSLLEAHAAPSAVRSRAAVAGTELALRPDHLVLEGHAATLALLAFESLLRPRAPLEAVLISDGGEARDARFERADERTFRMAAARRAGGAFVRGAAGPVHQLYRARFAGPGRVALTCATGTSVAGALGSLVLATSEVEAGAALAGAPLTFVVPPITGVRLTGTLPTWAGGHDVVCALARRLAAAGIAGGVLEFEGPGVDALPIAERCAIARGIETLGVAACLFPSDERTRSWLHACGRESDWKLFPTAAEADAAAMVELDLDAIEPMCRDAGTRTARSLHDAGTITVSRVCVGPDADVADLMRLAVLVRGRGKAAEVDVVVHVATRAFARVLTAAGAWSALEAAGVRLLHPGALPTPPAAHGATLMCGVPEDDAGRAAQVRIVSIPVAAAAALTGRLADPRQLFAEPPAAFDVETLTPDDLAMAKPSTNGSAEAPPVATVRPLPSAPPLTTALRGPVLIAIGERSAARRILPTGPRVWRHASDIAALAARTFADVDPGFADRARASRGGFVVAGGGFGEGAGQPHAALALVELGVRAVLARSFAPGCASTLVRHGVLPMVFSVPGDAATLGTGDEIEIPGLPEGLEPRKPLVVRDLTRGGQVLVHHDLEAREIEIVRAGGLLNAVRSASSARATAMV